MENYQVLQNMKPEELQELLQIYRAKNEGLNIAGQMHKPVMVNSMEESLLASLPNTSGQIDAMTGLRSYHWQPGAHEHTETTTETPTTTTTSQPTITVADDGTVLEEQPDGSFKPRNNTTTTTTGDSSGYGTYAGGDTPTKTQGWNTSPSGNITKNIGGSLVTGVPDGKGGYTFISSGG